MTNDSRQTGSPVAISFTEYRDGEIADFFANESRTFHPDAGVGPQSEFGRKRVVGRPHFAASGKVDIDFRPSSESRCPRDDTGQGKPEQQAKTAQKKDRTPESKETVSQNGSNGTIPLPLDFLESDHGIVSATLGGESRRKRLQDREPEFGKQARSLGSLLPPSNATEEQKAGRVLLDPLAGRTVRCDAPKKRTHSPDPQPEFPPVVSLAEWPTADEAVETDPRKEIVSLEDSLYQRCREVDEQLGRLVESWTRLPEDIRETIAALIDVAEKDNGHPHPFR